MNEFLSRPKMTIHVTPDKDIDQECDDILTSAKIVCQLLKLLRERGNIRSVRSLDYIHPGFNTCDDGAYKFFASIHYSVSTRSFHKPRQIKIFVRWHSKNEELVISHDEERTRDIKRIPQDKTQEATEWLPLALIKAVVVGIEDLASSSAKESVKLTDETLRLKKETP